MNTWYKSAPLTANKSSMLLKTEGTANAHDQSTALGKFSARDGQKLVKNPKFCDKPRQLRTDSNLRALRGQQNSKLLTIARFLTSKVTSSTQLLQPSSSPSSGTQSGLRSKRQCKQMYSFSAIGIRLCWAHAVAELLKAWVTVVRGLPVRTRQSQCRCKVNRL